MNRRKAYQSDFYVLFSDLPPLPQTIVVEPNPSRFRVITPQGWRVAADGQDYFCSHLFLHIVLDGLPRTCYVVVRALLPLSFDQENDISVKVFQYIQRTFTPELPF